MDLPSIIIACRLQLLLTHHNWTSYCTKIMLLCKNYATAQKLCYCAKITLLLKNYATTQKLCYYTKIMLLHKNYATEQKLRYFESANVRSYQQTPLMCEDYPRIQHNTPQLCANNALLVLLCKLYSTCI